MGETFSESERALLARYCTNADKDAFCLVNLPQVISGALFSRYSRSTKSLRRVLLDEFINNKETNFSHIVGDDVDALGKPKPKAEDQFLAVKKAEEFYERVLVGYGDDSVAELGGAHLALENISIVATKFVEDARLGLSPLEKSTRYVYFDQRDATGRWRYYREPVLMKSKHGRTYIETCDLLFNTYAKLVPKVSAFLEKKHPRELGVSERAYASTIRAKTCDLLRGLLPASTLTNMGFYGNGRAYEFLLTKMYASDLSEIRALGKDAHGELAKAIPAFVKRANDRHGQEMQAFYKQKRAAALAHAKKLLGNIDSDQKYDDEEVLLASFEPEDDAECALATAILYPHSTQRFEEVRAIVNKLSSEERLKIITDYVLPRSNRRHRPGRAFEHVYYTFCLRGNYGMYRDLHRHRVLTQERQLLSCLHGFDQPSELEEAGVSEEFESAMHAAAEAWSTIAPDFPNEAQYAVPLAYRIRWHFKMNLRECFHLIELRSQPQGHEDYRRMVIKMRDEIAKVHPNLAKLLTFVNTTDVELERLESEKGIDNKLARIKEKYGK